MVGFEIFETLKTPYIIDYPGCLNDLIVDVFKASGQYINLYYIGICLIFTFAIFFSTLSTLYSEDKIEIPPRSKALTSDTFFILLFSIMILALRIPTFLLPQQNPDESQWIANASTLIIDPRYWVSVNAGTSGPLNVFPVTLIYLLGGSLNYVTIRLFGLVACIIPSIIFLYKSLQNFTNKNIARIAILPIIFCFAFTNFRDIIAFNSEHIPIFLISISLFLLSRMVLSAKYLLSHSFLLGFILGLIPYAKLQAVPIALAIAFFMIYQLLITPKKNLKILIYFTAASIIPSLFVLSYVLYFNILKEFWLMYISFNFNYALGNEIQRSSKNILTKIYLLPQMFFEVKSIIIFFIPVILVNFAILCYMIRNKLWKKISEADRKTLILALLLIISSYYSVVQPGNHFYHYLFFFIYPFIFFSGILLFMYMKYNGTVEFDMKIVLVLIIISLSFYAFTVPGYIFFRKVILVYSFLFPIGFFLYLYTVSKENNLKKKVLRSPLYYLIIINILPVLVSLVFVNSFMNSLKYSNFLFKRSIVSDTILMYANPNERMIVWGWMNQFHVETGLIQGYRGICTLGITGSNNYENYFSELLMNDFKINRPKIFVDAISKNSFYFNDTASQRHENFPQLKTYIDKNYCLKSNIEGIRIYVRTQ